MRFHFRTFHAENRLGVIATTLKSLYVDKCSGKIPENIFTSLKNDLSTEQAEIEERLPKLKIELDKVKETKEEIGEWLSLIGSYVDLDVLTRNIVVELIDSITVSERKMIDGKVSQAIEIQYRFIGDLLNEKRKEMQKKEETA